MAGPLISGLPGLPSAAAGIPQTNPIAQLLQAVGGFPQQQREASYEQQQMQAAVEERKAQADARKKQAAKFGYDNLVQMAQNAPGIAKNPEFVNKFREHADVLGLPVPTAADGSFDAAALQPKKNFWELPESAREDFYALDKTHKTAMAGSGTITGITPEMIDAPAVVTPGSHKYVALQNEIAKVTSAAEKGEMTAEQFASEWNGRLKPTREALGVFGEPPAAITAGMGRAIAAKVRMLEEQGAQIPLKAKAALENAQSLAEYRKAEIDLLGIKGRQIPLAAQETIRHHKEIEQKGWADVALRRDNLARLKTQGGTNPGRAAGMVQAEMNKLVGEAQNTRNRIATLESARLNADNNFADKNSDSYKDLLTSLGAARGLLQQQDAAVKEYSQNAGPIVTNYLHTVMGGKGVKDLTKPSMNDPGSESDLVLTVDQIRKVAKERKWTYDQAVTDARRRGYIVRSSDPAQK